MYDLSPVSEFVYICLNTAPRYHIVTMKSILFLGVIAAMTIVATISGLGLDLTLAQMADNATMGNMTGGNMTMDMGNTTDATGSISGAEEPFGP